MRRVLFGILATVLVFSGVGVRAQEAREEAREEGEIFVKTELHSSLFTDAPDRSVFAASRGGGLEVGYRPSHRWGVFLHVEQNRWLASEVEQELTQGVLNIALGSGFRLFEDRVRVSVAAGTSTLLFDTFLDEAGSTGLYVDVRPGSFRWHPLEWLTLELQPLSYALMMPVMDRPRVVVFEYRGAFSAEWRFK